MANWSTLKAAIADTIKTNGNQEITGAILQNTLNSIISAVGENATFAGIATSSTNPGSPDGPVFYLASSAGVFSNFDGLEVLEFEVAILANNSDGSWSKYSTGFASNNTVGETVGLSNVGNRSIYVDAIKFIAFVPADAYKDHTFSVYALSAYENKSLDEPNPISLNIWILDEELVKEQQKEVNIAKIALPASTDISKLVFSKTSNSYGTFYAIIDWKVIINYKNSSGKYSYIIWSANWTNIEASNLVHVQKLNADDPRIVNWDAALKTSQLSDTYGTSENKISNEFLTAALFGIQNGLSFNFPERYANELKAMRIVKKAYFSFKGDTEQTGVGIGVLGNGGGDGTKFWFGFGNLDGTGQGYGTTSLIPIEDVPDGIKTFYVESNNYKWYVEIDFSAWKELGNVVWSWSTPCCKLNNIIPEDSDIWKQIRIENTIQKSIEFTEYKGEADFLLSASGYISSSNGAITGEIWQHVVFKCKEGDSIKVDISIASGAIGSNICAVYAIYNSENTFNAANVLVKGPQWDSKAEDYSDTITIPSGAKSIAFCYQRLNKIDVKTIAASKNAIEVIDSLRKCVYPLHLIQKTNVNLQLKAAIIDARLILDDESMHNAFWNSGHSFEHEGVTTTSDKKLFGICQSTNSDYLIFYWMKPNGDYIPWNSSWNVSKGQGVAIYDDTEYIVKAVSLDDYSAKLHIVIDWSKVPHVSTVFSHNYLDNSIISVSHDGIIRDTLLSQKLSAANISPTQFSDMTKLNFGVDGDSITAGNQWSYYVTQYLGFANHHNVGVGSATWACKKQTLGDVTYQTQEYDAEDFAGISSGHESTTDPVEIQKRCNNCAKVHVQKFIDEVTKGTYPEPDVFAFAMGTNDSDKTSADAAISTGTDYPSGDMLFTLPGAMKWCIQKIHETYPDCKIFILLPIQRYTGGNENNLQKIEIMKDIAKAFSVEVIDMYSNCGISSMLETGTGPYLRDGLHPNTAGQKLMGKYAASIIRNYIAAT